MTGLVIGGLAAIAFVAFATEAALGFAGTVLTMSLGAQLVPLDVLLPIFVPINLLLSLSIALVDWRQVEWRALLLELCPPVALGAAAGLALFRMPARLHLQLAFGIFVFLLAALDLLRMRGDAEAVPRRWTRRVLLVAGGMAHGLFGAGGPMFVYVLRRRFDGKAAFRATLAVVWLVLNGLLVANYAMMDLYSLDLAPAMVAMVTVLGPAFYIGDRLHRRVDPDVFHRIVVVVLLGAGAVLAVRTGIALTP